MWLQAGGPRISRRPFLLDWAKWAVYHLLFPRGGTDWQFSKLNLFLSVWWICASSVPLMASCLLHAWPVFTCISNMLKCYLLACSNYWLSSWACQSSNCAPDEGCVTAAIVTVPVQRQRKKSCRRIERAEGNWHCPPKRCFTNGAPWKVLIAQFPRQEQKANSVAVPTDI